MNADIKTWTYKLGSKKIASAFIGVYRRFHFSLANEFEFSNKKASRELVSSRLAVSVSLSVSLTRVSA